MRVEDKVPAPQIRRVGAKLNICLGGVWRDVTRDDIFAGTVTSDTRQRDEILLHVVVVFIHPHDEIGSGFTPATVGDLIKVQVGADANRQAETAARRDCEGLRPHEETGIVRGVRLIAAGDQKPGLAVAFPQGDFQFVSVIIRDCPLLGELFGTVHFRKINCRTADEFGADAQCAVFANDTLLQSCEYRRNHRRGFCR